MSSDNPFVLYFAGHRHLRDRRTTSLIQSHVQPRPLILVTNKIYHMKWNSLLSKMITINRYSIVYTLLATININKFMQWEIQPFFSLFYTFMNSIYVKCPSVPRQVSKVLKRARQICDMSRTCPGQIRTCPWTSPASCLNGAFLDILFEDFPN